IGLKRKHMKKSFWIQSDNRKSKIQNRKWAGLSVIAFVLSAVGVAAEQQPKIPRIGLLSGTDSSPGSNAFRQGLRELGYVEGKNVVVEFRYDEGKVERLPPSSRSSRSMSFSCHLCSGYARPKRPPRQSPSSWSVLGIQSRTASSS